MSKNTHNQQIKLSQLTEGGGGIIPFRMAMLIRWNVINVDPIIKIYQHMLTVLFPGIKVINKPKWFTSTGPLHIEARKLVFCFVQNLLLYIDFNNMT